LPCFKPYFVMPFLSLLTKIYEIGSSFFLFFFFCLFPFICFYFLYCIFVLDLLLENSLFFQFLFFYFLLFLVTIYFKKKKKKKKLTLHVRTITLVMHAWEFIYQRIKRIPLKPLSPQRDKWNKNTNSFSLIANSPSMLTELTQALILSIWPYPIHCWRKKKPNNII
jgi:hypothetical protein